jgi:radical SAM-linked protein
MRYALLFEKGERARWLGHLDVVRTFERALRRSQLPVAFTNGFNPRIKLAFASALGVGSTGGAEVAVLELTEETPSDEIANRLNATLPPCFRVHSVQAIQSRSAGEYLSGFTHARMRIWCRMDANLTISDVESAIKSILHRDELIVTRIKNGKTLRKNIRPCLVSILIENVNDDRLILQTKQDLTRDSSAKPSEIAEALDEILKGISYIKAHRIELLRE